MPFFKSNAALNNSNKQTKTYGMSSHKAKQSIYIGDILATFLLSEYITKSNTAAKESRKEQKKNRSHTPIVVTTRISSGAKRAACGACAPGVCKFQHTNSNARTRAQGHNMPRSRALVRRS